MKLSKDELKQKIDTLAIDDDVKITLLEDVEDSFVETVDNSEELQELNAKYEELKEKYKNRFLKGEEKEEKEDSEEKVEELKEEDVVEEEDIFKIKEEEEE